MSQHEDLQGLKEFTAGDEFNYNHRHKAGFDHHWASDLDLVLIEREPNPHISAFLEFKNRDEEIRFTQAVVFNALQSVAPCFVVVSENEMLDAEAEEQSFTIKRFDSVEDYSPSPPEVNLTEVASGVSWGGLVDNSEFALNFGDSEVSRGLIDWEDELRRQGRKFRGGDHL